MKLKNKKAFYLIVYSMLIVPIMIAIFSLFTNLLGKTLGYISAYSTYLILILCGIIIFRKSGTRIETKKSAFNILYYIIAFLPVVATFFVAFLPISNELTFYSISIVALYAITNATIEELFWRYTYNKTFGNNLAFAFLIPSIIFSCWHFALLFAQGMSYHGGALALVGGASFMGFLWGFVMYKTHNIKIVILAHMVTNFFAFSQLIHQNWFVK